MGLCTIQTVRSYPTYEEWKQSFLAFDGLQGISSYPTYEEWKPSSNSSSFSSTFGSYPTYEEWKLYETIFPPVYISLFLSYL